MKGDEPTPLLSAGPEDRELLELLEAGRSELPASDTVDALEARILPLLVAPPSSFPPPASGPGGGAAVGAGTAATGAVIASGASVGKLATAAVIAAAIGAGTWSLATERAEPATEPPRAVAPARVADVSPAVEAPASVPSPAVVGRRAPVSPAPPPAPDPAVIERPVRRGIASAPPAHTEPAPAPSEPPEAEAVLLSRAQAVLASSPRDALRLTNEHETVHPAGMLVPEREVIAIDALLRLGRYDEARARADRFLARSPGSAHARRVRVLISSEER